jgi:hypothetical protein
LKAPNAGDGAVSAASATSEIAIRAILSTPIVFHNDVSREILRKPGPVQASLTCQRRGMSALLTPGEARAAFVRPSRRP